MDFVQSTFIGQMLQAIFYGLYCVIFVLYLRIQLHRKPESKGLLVYALSINFMLCTAYLALGMAEFLKTFLADSSQRTETSLVGGLDALYTCIDFLSQGILIYRCWIMWRRLSVVIVPIILSLACLGTALTSLVVYFKSRDKGEFPGWWDSAIVSFFSISLVVNAVVTGLIVFKIVIVRRSLRIDALKIRNSYNRGRGSHYLFPVISILVESGMITFIGQLVQTILWKIDDASAFPIVSGIVVQLYGISPTIVLVRVAMGIAYDNETPMILPSQAIHFAEIRSDDTRTLDFTGNDPMDKHSPSQTIPSTSC